MAVMHLPMKCGADIFIQSGVINIFRSSSVDIQRWVYTRYCWSEYKYKMVAAAILDLFG